MTVAELITQLQAMPLDAPAVDADELEVTHVLVSRDHAIVTLLTEEK